MLYSVHAPNAPASVSFGERRLGHTPLPKSFSLCIGLVARQSQTTQPAPYPSPPMTGLSPPDTFSLQRQKTERQPLDQEIQTQNIPRDKRQHQLFQSPDDPPEALSTVSATGDSGIPQPGQMTVTSPIGRSPFLAQTSMPAQQQRKTKSHVASACVNCKKAHLACDVRRPCPRCVSLNKQDTCIDVQHKKRGRPRLRDERTHSFEVNQIGSLSSSISHLHHHQGSIEHHNHGDRVIKSQAGDSHSRIARSLSSYALRSPQSSQELTRYFDDRPSVVVQGSSSSSYNVKRTPQFDLQAFTTVDLVIAWSTEKLRGFLGCQERELNCMKSLFDIVSLDDHKKLYRLAGQIQEEVQRRDSTYLSPPAQTVFAIIRNTGLSDMEPAFYASLMEETLDLRVASGRN
ncbi:hypothetical protein BDZ91DRAFT_306959 [Kalaharituber pfeilii]|nr:hypothetical protein BDZ91DRAFT_306959 [Kalaharituber pfeilii]